MCDPLTIGYATVMAYGQHAQGQAQSDSFNAQAKISDMKAKDAIERGEIAENKSRRETASFKGEQTAGIGASGVEISGSKGEILQDTEMMGELDALTIRSNAEKEAFYHKYASDVAKANASNSRRTGNFNAIGTLLTAAATVDSSWLSPDSAGAGGLSEAGFVNNNMDKFGANFFGGP